MAQNRTGLIECAMSAIASGSADRIASPHCHGRRSPVRDWDSPGAEPDLRVDVMALFGGRCGGSSVAARSFLDRSERQNSPGGAAWRGW